MMIISKMFFVFIILTVQSVYTEIKYDVVFFVPKNLEGYFEGAAKALNENNEVTGYFTHNNKTHLFIGNQNGDYKIIYTTTNSCVPYSINDRGDIVGCLAELSEKGSIEEFNFVWASEEKLFKKYKWGISVPVSSSFNEINNKRNIAARLGSGNGFQGSGVIYGNINLSRIFEINKMNNSFPLKATGFSISSINNIGFCVLNSTSFPDKNNKNKKTSETYLMDVINKTFVYIGEGGSRKLNDNMDILCGIKINGKYQACIWNNGNIEKIEEIQPITFNNSREVVGTDSNYQGLIWKKGKISKLIDLVGKSKYQILNIENPNGINSHGSISCIGVIKINDKKIRVPVLLVPS